MARTIRDAKLETRGKRARLAQSQKPYWKTLVPGRLHLGYRKKSKDQPGTWLVRRYLGNERYRLTPLGIADVPVKLDHLINVLTFLVIIIPFYHGVVRHLFATYVEEGGSSRIKNGALLADFYLLFIEGCLFVMMASVAVVAAGSRFHVGISGMARFYRSTGSTRGRIWSLINVVTADILAILIFAPDVFAQKPLLSQVGLLAIIGVRTILDYFACWNFYFPPAE